MWAIVRSVTSSGGFGLRLKALGSSCKTLGTGRQYPGSQTMMDTWCKLQDGSLSVGATATTTNRSSTHPFHTGLRSLLRKQQFPSPVTVLLILVHTLLMFRARLTDMQQESLSAQTL